MRPRSSYWLALGAAALCGAALGACERVPMAIPVPGTQATTPASSSSGSNSNSSSTTPLQPIHIQMMAASPFYSPNTCPAVVGQSITWTNSDSGAHTVTGADFDSGSMNPSGTYTHVFTTPGTYTYRCTFHPWMTGTVVVTAK